MNELNEVFFSFLKLGFFAFGGPAAHIAMMEKEFVQSKQWLTQDEFMDMLGFTNLIPGPNSTEMALHIGYKKAKIAGLLIAGVSFILPATLMVIGLSMVMNKLPNPQTLNSLLLGIIPIIIGLLMQVSHTLFKSQIKTFTHLILFSLALSLSFLNFHELSILVICALVSLFIKVELNHHHVFEPLSLLMLFLIFLKIGSILYGSGYVLLSFLKTEFLIPNYLSLDSIMTAMTLGQITPGPVFTTATAIGYQLQGVWGAIVSTLGIFLPSFIFVLILSPFFHKIKENTTIQVILLGLKIASLALLFRVIFDLIVSYGFQPLLILSPLAYWIFMKTQLNPTWLIIIGGSIGFLWLS